MNYDEMYYHGLSGDVFGNVKLEIEKSLSRLESIVKSGGIFSKNMLISNGLSEYIGKPVFNGDEYVSVCVKDFPETELHGVNEGLNSSYDCYIKNHISIVIDKSIEEKCIFRSDYYDRLPGERQVKDKIDISYFKAIQIGIEENTLRSIVTEMVSDILSRYDVNIPIVDANHNNLVNTKTL